MKICIVCLCSSTKDLLSSNSIELLAQCFGERPIIRTNLTICRQCFDQIESFQRLKLQWQSSQEKLNEIYSSEDVKCVDKLSMNNRRPSNPEQCAECGKIFQYSGYLKTHMRIHRDEKPFECTECGQRFNQSSNLRSHQRMHAGEQPFQCEICSKSFSTSSNLKVHLRSHSEQRDFECVECSVRFKSNAELNNHQKKHSGIRKFKCDRCEKEFYKVAYLNVHVRTVHLGEKRHACNICRRNFSNTSNLLRHQQTHSGAKPFTCNECQKTFSSKFNLRRHTQTHIDPQIDVTTREFDHHAEAQSNEFVVPSPVDSIESNMALNVDDDDDEDPENQCLAASLLASAIANETCEETSASQMFYNRPDSYSNYAPAMQETAFHAPNDYFRHNSYNMSCTSNRNASKWDVEF